MASSGPRYPSQVATVAVAPESANDWLTAANVFADDGSEAQITAATFDANDVSYRLRATNWGFAIPAGATINGIVVEIDRRCFAGAAADYRVQLGRDITAPIGDNKASASAWPATSAVATYGSSSDTWAAGLTVGDLNTSLVVFLAVQATASNTDIGVDFIRVTVHYTPVADTALVGSSAGAATAGGALSTQIRLAGPSAGTGSAAGVLTTAVALVGSGAGSASASGVLSNAAASFAGSAQGTSAGSGAMTTGIALQGALAGFGGAAGALTTAIAATGAATGTATGSGALTTAVRLVGQSAGQGSSIGALTTAIALVGASAGGTSAAGILTSTADVALAGGAAGTSAGTGALTTVIHLTGSSVGAGAAAAGLTTSIRFTGTAPGIATAAAALGSVAPVVISGGDPPPISVVNLTPAVRVALLLPRGTALHPVPKE